MGNDETGTGKRMGHDMGQGNAHNIHFSTYSNNKDSLVLP
jgi:hypothetical protein